jgi:TM2 domain-containing membrane protein YozV
MDEKTSQWYYVYNGQQQGPVDEGTMQQLLQTRAINANTLIWQVGMPGWLPLQSTSLQTLVPVTSVPPAPPQVVSTHNKVTAGVLGILLGGFGAHKFYLGQIGMGILYLVFCWTGIPSIIGLIEGIIYLTMQDQDFAQKYG